MTCEEFRLLMTAQLDGELGPEDTLRLESHRRECPSCRKEMEVHRQLKAMTCQLHFRQPEEGAWQAYWANVYNRLERKIAWFFLIVGLSLLGGYSILFLFEILFLQQTIPWPLRAGCLLVLAGLFLLLLSVVRERFFLRKTDRYEGILR
jgi:hypothetical protein